VPTDYKAELINNLLSFYDFEEKTVISVGADGSSMVEYAKDIKKVLLSTLIGWPYRT